MQHRVSMTFYCLMVLLLLSNLTSTSVASPHRGRALPVIHYVRENGTGDGSNWTNASGNLQAMINASASGDQVWVAQGTYKPTTGTDRNISFSMKNGVTIYGGFPTTGTPTINDRNPANFPTILSGDIGATGNSDNSYHVIFNSNLDNTAVLDGFIITEGNTEVESYSVTQDFRLARGGGMFLENSSPTLTNCSFKKNTGYWGGGMYIQESGAPRLTNCSFINNETSGAGGGGLYNSGGSPILDIIGSKSL